MIEKILRKKGSVTEILIIVQPNSLTEGLGGIDEWRGRLVVKTRAKPIEGSANTEIIKFFSNLFRVSKNAVRITSGQRSRQKTIEIEKDFIETKTVLKQLLGID